MQRAAQRVPNFRDCGDVPTRDGRRMRAGRVYRSGRLDQARAADREALQALGMRTIVDLRSPQERRFHADPDVGARQVALPWNFDQVTQTRLMPLLLRRHAGTAIITAIAGLYRELVDTARPQLRTLFDVLLETTAYPVLLHCRAGRDRTGFACAVIQLALGVEPAAVTAHYLQSNAYRPPGGQQMLTLLKVLTLGLFPTANIETTFMPQARYIHTVQDTIEQEYGGIGEYLGQCGIMLNEIQVLRGLLLE